MSKQNPKTIFQKGSRTFYVSSLFFPKEVKRDVTNVYAFFRVVDDFVDAVPQKRREFETFIQKYYTAIQKNTKSTNAIIDAFIELQKTYSFKQEWVDAFIHSMRLDTQKSLYITRKQTAEYIYGSAEVIGLFMAKILKLPTQSQSYAKKLGFAFQYINMIRDIREDRNLKRQYIPQKVLQKAGLQSLQQKDIEQNVESFIRLIRSEITYYLKIQQEATKGFSYIPYRYRIPIKAASYSYEWTAKTIFKNPFILFTKKVKPSKVRMIWFILKGALTK